VANAFADYTIDNAYGRTVLGFGYSLTQGQQYARGRAASWSFLNPELLELPLVGEDLFEVGHYTDYMDGKRTHGKFPTVVYHDLVITHDFNLFKVMNTNVRAFVKLTISNFFNHQQRAGYLTPAYLQIEDDGNPSVTPENTPFRVDAAQRPWGWDQDSTYWAAPRTYAISLGVRF
jgi:hypothetical protein